MRTLFVPLTALLLAGCMSAPIVTPTTTVQSVDSQGRVVQVTTTTDGRGYADVEMARATAECWQAYAASQQTSDALVAAINQLGNAASNQQPCASPTNSNDAEIARTNANGRIAESAMSFGKVLVGGYLGGKALGALGAAAGSGGVTINGDNNGVRGTNTGDNGRANYTEQTSPYGGIPLNPAETNPVSIESTGETSNQCTALGGIWVAEESRCSDGSGGTIDF